MQCGGCCWFLVFIWPQIFTVQQPKAGKKPHDHLKKYLINEIYDTFLRLWNQNKAGESPTWIDREKKIWLRKTIIIVVFGMMFFIQPEHRFLSFLRRRVRFWTAEARGSLCTGEEVTKATSPASILASTRSFKVLARMSRRIEADGRPLPTTLILFLPDWKFQNK